MTNLKNNFCKLNEVSNIYVDAVVGSEIIFLSAWGTDTSLKEFIGKLSLNPRKGGFKSMYIQNTDNTYNNYHYIEKVERLEKHTGRAAKHSLFGELIHLWLYDRLTLEMDYASRKAILLKQRSEKEDLFQKRLWQAVMNLCPIPLLDKWQFLLDDFENKSWIKYTKGFQVDAVELDFSSNEVEQFISTSVRDGQLKLSEIPKKEPAKRTLFVLK